MIVLPARQHLELYDLDQDRAEYQAPLPNFLVEGARRSESVEWTQAAGAVGLQAVCWKVEEAVVNWMEKAMVDCMGTTWLVAGWMEM